MASRQISAGLPSLTPGVKVLLAVIGFSFVAQLIVSAALGFDAAVYRTHVIDWLGLNLPRVLEGRVWQPLTYMFLHSMDGFGHVLMNCLALYFFGTAVEERTGRKALYKIAFGAGIAGALAVLGTQALTQAFGGSGNVPVVGASGAISGIAGAFCWLFWDRWLSFFVLRLKGKHLLILIVAVDLVRAIGPSNVSVSCHFGGLTFGLLWITGWIQPRTAYLALRHWWLKRRLRVIHRNDPDEQPEYLN